MAQKFIQTLREKYRKKEFKETENNTNESSASINELTSNGHKDSTEVHIDTNREIQKDD